MKRALVAMEEAVYFKSNTEDINETVEEADLADATEVDLLVEMEEKEAIGVVDKMLKWCNVMAYDSWRFIHNMNSLTMNGTGYMRQK